MRWRSHASQPMSAPAAFAPAPLATMAAGTPPTSPDRGTRSAQGAMRRQTDAMGLLIGESSPYEQDRTIKGARPNGNEPLVPRRPPCVSRRRWSDRGPRRHARLPARGLIRCFNRRMPRAAPSTTAVCSAYGSVVSSVAGPCPSADRGSGSTWDGARVGAPARLHQFTRSIAPRFG